MTRRLGIELSPTRCALIDLDVSSGGQRHVPARVRSFRTIPWSPENAEPFVATLRLLRKSRIVPSRAVVALWGLGGDKPSEAQIRLRLAPLVAAQFSIDAVITPAMALSSLSRLLPGAAPGAVRACVAVNTEATAVAIARGGSLLFAREIALVFRANQIADDADWARSAGALDFARRLAPELKRSFLAFRQQENIDVRQVVLCGDFPGLRLLTSPLMAALQAEVETLDTIRGLATVGSDIDATLLEQAAALRVAWAAGMTPSHSTSLLPPGTARGGTSNVWLRRLVPVAATVLVALAGWLAVSRTALVRTGGAPAPRDAARPSAATLAKADANARGLGEAAAAPHVNSPTAAPALPPGRMRGRGVKPPIPSGVEESPAPVVQSILYGADRRLALIDHHIVRVGDRLEAGVVADIEPKAVVVRRPSGQLLRVKITRPTEGK